MVYEGEKIDKSGKIILIKCRKYIIDVNKNYCFNICGECD